MILTIHYKWRLNTSISFSCENRYKWMNILLSKTIDIILSFWFTQHTETIRHLYQCLKGSSYFSEHKMCIDNVHLYLHKCCRFMFTIASHLSFCSRHIQRHTFTQYISNIKFRKNTKICTEFPFLDSISNLWKVYRSPYFFYRVWW